jgi:hypothetical protein
VADEDELTELRALAGRHDPSVAWESPPDDLWARIAAEAGVEELAGESAPDVGPGGADPSPVQVTPVPPSSVPPSSVQPSAGAEVRELRPRGRSGAPWLLAAAAALVVVVGGGLWLGRSQEPTVVAAAELELLGDRGAGAAELVEEDGSLRLRVDTSDLAAPDGFVEVWVIDEEVSKLVSLGPLRPDGVYELPDGLDPEAFPIVDVSFEPLDGDPAHSGDSVLRGQLEF